MEIENIVANTVLLKAREGESRGARRRGGRRSGRARRGGLGTYRGGGKGSEVRGKGASRQGGEEVMEEEERVGREERLPGRGVRAGRGPPQGRWQERRVPGSALRHLPCSSRGADLELLACGLHLGEKKKKKSPSLLRPSGS